VSSSFLYEITYAQCIFELGARAKGSGILGEVEKGGMGLRNWLTVFQGVRTTVEF
jgi:hypothetical protein